MRRNEAICAATLVIGAAFVGCVDAGYELEDIASEQPRYTLTLQEVRMNPDRDLTTPQIEGWGDGLPEIVFERYYESELCDATRCVAYETDPQRSSRKGNIDEVDTAGYYVVTWPDESFVVPLGAELHLTFLDDDLNDDDEMGQAHFEFLLGDDDLLQELEDFGVTEIAAAIWDGLEPRGAAWFTVEP